MTQNEQREVKGTGGPGGIRCRCCGDGRNTNPARRKALRRQVRALRAAHRRGAIREGWLDVYDRPDDDWLDVCDKYKPDDATEEGVGVG